MKAKYKTISIYSLVLIIFFNAGCKKQDEFLDAKPNQALVVPATLEDFQTLLNNTNIFNIGNDPALGEISTDDFYVTPSVLQSSAVTPRNSYTWNKQIYDAGARVTDWGAPYLQVYYANNVLDGLARKSFPSGQQALYNQIKGTALFYRSYAFYNLVQTFALPYDPATAKTDAGILLRLSADLNIKVPRSSEQECYDQILADLNSALPLLPLKGNSPTQPSQIAVNALLARIYLAIGDYPNALVHADNCLQSFSILTDFNSLNAPTATSISSTFMVEDIYHSSIVNYSIFAGRRNAVVDSVLYLSYDNNDLRKSKFFAILDGLSQYPRFVGSYDYIGYKYDGLATDEMFLIRAECNARAGNNTAALGDLNTLLKTRWKAGTFIPLTAASANEALSLILTERRKELLFRGLRWTDLRRLNRDSRFKTDLTRNLGGTIYNLPAGDARYALPIPDAEIALSGIPQNQR
jgi:hypothetical protein